MKRGHLDSDVYVGEITGRRMDELFRACAGDAERAVAQALAKGLDKDEKGQGGVTALHVCG